MANDQQEKSQSIDDLLALVDLGTSEPGTTSTASATAPAVLINQRNPLVQAFLGCVDAWREVTTSSGLAKVGHGMKYAAIFAAFTDKFSGTFRKDDLGQYANLGDGRKLRPIDEQNHALFFRAVRYRFE